MIKCCVLGADNDSWSLGSGGTDVDTEVLKEKLKKSGDNEEFLKTQLEVLRSTLRMMGMLLILSCLGCTSAYSLLFYFLVIKNVRQNTAEEIYWSNCDNLKVMTKCFAFAIFFTLPLVHRFSNLIDILYQIYL